MPVPWKPQQDACPGDKRTAGIQHKAVKPGRYGCGSIGQIGGGLVANRLPRLGLQMTDQEQQQTKRESAKTAIHAREERATGGERPSAWLLPHL